VRIVDDESRVRRLAEAALADARSVGLECAASVDYELRVSFPDFAALRRRLVGVDAARAPLFDRRAADLSAAFDELGEAAGSSNARAFRQPMRAWVLRPF
jgi:phage terminase large subunit-like protein